MKKLFYILTILAFGFTQAQPQKVNYQAVALTAGGQTVKNQAIKLRLSIVDSSATGTVLYTETHQPTTDGAGQFSVFLGGGTSTLGTFSTISWSNGKDKFLKAEADVTGGTNYVLMGTSQIVSVPYAIHANTATKIVDSASNEYQIKTVNGQPSLVTLPGSGTPAFACGQSVTYAGESYPTVQIGTQCWFQKNLNVGNFLPRYINQNNDSIIEKYCYLDNSELCEIFGGWYQYSEAMNYQNSASNTTLPSPAFVGNVQGICPNGWHIPNNSEFCYLIGQFDPMYICNPNNASNYGSLLISGKYWKNSNAINSLFNALPSGNIDNISLQCYSMGEATRILTVSNSNSGPNYVQTFYIFYSNPFGFYATFDNTLKGQGFSVRCLKD
jgi:uncharacterized protein (TIGR02145 family)